MVKSADKINSLLFWLVNGILSHFSGEKETSSRAIIVCPLDCTLPVKKTCNAKCYGRNISRIYGAPYWTLLQTFLIYAQLQIYLLNFTLSTLIAIFSCQIPSTYAMFYKKVSCVLIQYGQLYVPYGMMHRAPVSLK